VTAFALKHGGMFTTRRLADVAEVKWKGKTFICIKPTTYVNLSGKAFKYWMDKESIALENTLTIVDEIAIPLNRLRLRPGGSSGGHNGLADIEIMLGTPQYPKLRFGIGNNYPKGMQVDYVLGKWFPEEIKIVEKKIAACVDTIENFASSGIERTMNLINKQEFV
jgi:PTH1 family peptidyl-tRNA hydrolase